METKVEEQELYCRGASAAYFGYFEIEFIAGLISASLKTSAERAYCSLNH